MPHYCRVEALVAQNNNWTPLERRLLSIPTKKRDEPPAVGQAFAPCHYYDLPYEQLSALPFDEALRQRDLLLADGEKSSKPLACSQWNYNFTEVDFPSSIVSEVRGL